MSLRDFLLTIAVVTVFSWVATITVLYYIDPEASGILGVAMFYASFLLALLGTFTLLGVSVRMLFKKIHHSKTIAFKFVAPSVRQAVWFSIVGASSLLLSSVELFNWWSVGLLFLALILLEGFYLSKQYEQQPRSRKRTARTSRV